MTYTNYMLKFFKNSKYKPNKETAMNLGIRLGIFWVGLIVLALGLHNPILVVAGLLVAVTGVCALFIYEPPDNSAYGP